MRAPRNRRWLLLQVVVTVVVVVSVGYSLAGQWRKYRDTPLSTDVHWGYLLLSGAMVLATYALLVETWRRILHAWNERLSFRTAVEIWCISNLVRYVPGRVWQIGAMGVMAQRANVSPAAAAGSAIVSTVVNIAVGFAVALLAAWGTVNQMSGGRAALGLVIAAAALAGVFALPALMPAIVERARRSTGMEIAQGTFPRRAVYIAIVGNVIAWLLYGAAFQIFVLGILGATPGRTLDYIGAYAGSYIIGYLAFVVPGGLVVREAALVNALTLMGLADPKQAAVVAVTSRLWLTVLEIVPGVYFWARRTPPRPEETLPHNGST